MTTELNVCTPAAPPGAPAPGPGQVDFGAIKQRQHATWASGNYAIVGTTLQIVGEHLAEAVDLRAGEEVLDVAAGNGNATLAAARRFARVTSTDYVPELLEKGAERARANGLEVHFQAADAEDLPFADGAFDVALSTFGVMFAPHQARAARELTRVVRGGGRIGLANWTPEGFIGDLFRLIASYVPPPAGVQSPMRWEPSRASSSCSARMPPTSAASDAASTFAINPPRTGSRCSATSTAPPTRCTPRSIPIARRA